MELNHGLYSEAARYFLANYRFVGSYLTDFSHPSRNIELFIIVIREEQEISKEARSGQHQLRKFDYFLGWCCTYSHGVLSLSKICLQTVERVSENVRGLRNFKEFSEFPLPKSVLTRLKSVIAFLKYFSDIITNKDGVFSQPCYLHLNTPIDQWEHAAI